MPAGVWVTRNRPWWASSRVFHLPDEILFLPSSVRGRHEIGQCTVFFYQRNHQGVQTCTSAAVEALKRSNIRSAAPWITSERLHTKRLTSTTQPYQQTFYRFYEKCVRNTLLISPMIVKHPGFSSCALSEVVWWVHTQGHVEDFICGNLQPCKSTYSKGFVRDSDGNVKTNKM